MARVLITHIGTLAGITPAGCLRKCGAEMADFTAITDAWLTVSDGRIEAFGQAATQPEPGSATLVVDVQGGMVLPAFCDAHTHIVFAGSREQEFEDKIRGLSYAEIARRGGGILNSADRLHAMSEQELYDESIERVREVMRKGTGCLEIKSGYGLNTADELKMLRVTARIKQAVPARVVSTFLGAHAVGRAYQGRQDDYVKLVINEMIPAVAAEQLADFIDVFCDQGFFTPEQTARILEAGARYGLRPKIHGQELADSGGVRVAVEHQALSVDHLESSTPADVELLRGSGTMPTALPGTSFFLNMPYAPARQMIDAGLPLAVASDYNPGSTPSGDMKFVVSLACIKLRLQPAEALNAATLNGAAAMGLSQDYGSIEPGKVANLIITRPVPSLAFIPYAYTTPIISQVWLQGRPID